MRAGKFLCALSHIFGADLKLTCSCGKGYWPSQKWIHERCVVVNATNEVVVNGRSKDRHRRTEARREYMRLKMRDRRSRGLA